VTPDLPAVSEPPIWIRGDQPTTCKTSEGGVLDLLKGANLDSHGGGFGCEFALNLGEGVNATAFLLGRDRLCGDLEETWKRELAQALLAHGRNNRGFQRSQHRFGSPWLDTGDLGQVSLKRGFVERRLDRLQRRCMGSCGVQLQPLVDAMKAELLQHRVLHADETPVAMLKPGNGKTHRAYLWAYATGAFENTKVVVYDFCESRSGEHARRFLGDWRGSLTCDDFSGYKALIASGVTEVGCLAHARRKFFDLHAANQSQIAEFALQQFARVYEIEREVKELSADQRQAIWQQQTKPLLDALNQWMLLQRQKVPEGSASAKALDYSLRRWEALTRFASDGQLPVDNNWIENQIRPIALGRSNWLFAGSLRAGQRAAAVMSLIQSARMNGHDPYSYLRDVMARLPMQRASQIGELLPHRWQP